MDRERDRAIREREIQTGRACEECEKERKKKEKGRKSYQQVGPG